MPSPPSPTTTASIPRAPVSIPTPSPELPPAKPLPTPRRESRDEIVVPPNAKVIYHEVGWASWYGPGFQNRKGANGEVFDTNKMTAAHRTLPLNSIVRVTDLKTNESVIVRITDRGPFVGDRILDLSRAAARKLSVFQRGTALVRLEVLETPTPIASGGRWCVQIGAFPDHEQAAKLKQKLTRRYHTAKVLQFSSPMGGDWLRVLVANDDKKRAEELIHETQTDAAKFLVRID
ncbi:MAG TPA: septal ring lytic transglycosylase RlpA family protein [Candidatus Acidoferrales bacterium]|nr:septal ring lytic transglycosylase RlpA family protein [Candidatus Acidoferrales bacterium]